MDSDELLVGLRTQPELYLGRASFNRLIRFLAGYLHGEKQFAEISSDAASLDTILGQFDAWVQAHYGFGTTHGSQSLIRVYSQDDRDAYHRFWTLFDEFVESQGRHGPPANG